MKLLKVTIAFIALVSLQIAAVEWLNVPPQPEARMNMAIVGGGVPVAGATCNIYKSTTDVDTTPYPVGDVDTSYYIGWRFTDATSPCVCRVDVEMIESAGNIDSKTYYVKLWAVGASSSLTEATLLGTSTGNAGSTITTKAYYQFNFSTCITLTGGTGNAYIMTVNHAGASDAENYASMYYDDEDVDGTYAIYTKQTIDLVQQVSSDTIDFHYKMYKE